MKRQLSLLMVLTSIAAPALAQLSHTKQTTIPRNQTRPLAAPRIGPMVKPSSLSLQAMPPDMIDRLTLKRDRVEFSQVEGISLKMTFYYRLQLATNARPRKFVLLVAGADSQGKINDEDPMCGVIAATLVKKGFVVAVADYRKFTRGVTTNDWGGLFSAAYSDLSQALGFVRSKTSTYNIDPNKVIVAGLSYGGMIQANISHQQNVAGLALASSFLSPGDLSGFLNNKNIPVAILHNQNDTSVPNGTTSWSVGGSVIAAELKRQGKTVYDDYLVTACSDGNHVPAVGVDSPAVVKEYADKFAAQIGKLVP